MVNDKRKIIVSRLAGASGPVSGEELSRVLGISRVAVWKHIRALSEEGCPVESTRRGYLLRPLADTLEDWSFPGLSLPVHHFDECVSTMETARFLFRKSPVPYAVIAERQTGGLDRNLDNWPSPQGGIYLTLVTPPLFPWERAAEYNRLGAEAVLSTLSERIPGHFRIVPPARIHLDDSRVAGVMTEFYGPFDNPEAAAIGIGIYVNGSSPSEQSLADRLGHTLSRREILTDLLERLSASVTKEL